MPAEGPPATIRESKDHRKAAAKGEGPIIGKLLDHGKEHYRFDPKADLSYFVRVETAQGKRLIWGADFERSLKHSLSQPQIGDEVVLQHRGTDNVKVTRRERDGAGKVINETPVDTHRNTWSIERRDFLEERARAAATLRDPAMTPKRIVENHPELAGTILQLRAARITAQRIRNAEDREKFVNTVRNELAEKVARGDPLRPVTLYDRTSKRPVPERDQAPTR
jgi:putative DNA primase/helicase